MAWFPIANIVPQYVDENGDPFSGAVLKAYKVNTLTAIPFATDNTGSTTVNSVALNASGNPEVSGNVVIPHIDQDYKLALYPDQTAADSDSGALWTVDDLDLMGFDSGSLNPEHATDSGTDAYVSATNTTAPAAGVQIVRDFQSANTTTTPTLDGKTITDRDGNALWSGAISGVHSLQYDSGADTYLLLDPRPIDEDDMASDSDAAVPTQQSVKAWGLAAPSTSSDPSLAFDTWRTPNADRPTLVAVEVYVETDGASGGIASLEVDESGGTISDYSLRIAFAQSGLGSGEADVLALSAVIPAGGSYLINNGSDPNNNNSIREHREFAL